VENASLVGGYFQERLRSLQEETGKISEVRGLGLMLAVELEEAVAGRLVLECLERGYVLNNIGDRVLRFLPPLCISTKEVDGLLEVLGELLSA